MRVATYNLRFTLDHWNCRREACLNVLKEMKADIYGLQEVNIGGSFHGQHRDIAKLFPRAHQKRQYHAAILPSIIHVYLGSFILNLMRKLLFFLWDICALISSYLERILGNRTEALFYHPLGKYALVAFGSPMTFGCAMQLASSAVKEDSKSYDICLIGSFCVAQRLKMTTSNGTTFWFCNTHLTSYPDETLRSQQVVTILKWMEPYKNHPIIITGDFNSTPSEKVYQIMANAGFRSAYRSVHGSEPKYTYPTPLRGPSSPKEADMSPKCLDYVWLYGDGISAQACSLYGNECIGGDCSLYPSDHFGLVAEISF